MAQVKLVNYDEASPEVRAVFDDIMASRKTDYINNIWRALAVHPPLLKRFWGQMKEVMVKPSRLRSAHQGTALSRGERHQQLRVLHQLPYLRRPQARDWTTRCSPSSMRSSRSPMPAIG